MRKQIFFLGIALLVLFTAGCAKRSSAERRTSIEYMYSGGVANIKIMEAVKKVFEKDNPHYKLRLNFISNWGAFQVKVMTDIAGGLAPDIIADTPLNIYNLYGRQALYDLTDYVTQDPTFRKIKKDIYPPQLLNIGKIKGKYWAIPAWQNPTVIFYNKKLFKESGIALPKNNWTFEEFTKDIKKLTKRGEKGKVTQYGLLYDGSLPNLLPLNAASYINREGTKVVLNSEKAYKILKWYHDLIFKYKVAPRMVAGQTEGMMEPYQLFQMGRAAMLMGGHYLKRQFLKSKSLDFDVAPVPKMSKDGKIFDNVIFWVVLKKGKNPEAALKLLNYLAGPTFQKEVCKLNNDVPILSSLQNSPLFLKPGERPEHARVFIDSLKTPFFGERCLSPELTRRAVNLGLAFIGQKNLKEALNEDTVIVQRSLDEAKKEGKLNFKNF